MVFRLFPFFEADHLQKICCVATDQFQSMYTAKCATCVLRMLNICLTYVSSRMWNVWKNTLYVSHTFITHVLYMFHVCLTHVFSFHMFNICVINHMYILRMMFHMCIIHEIHVLFHVLKSTYLYVRKNKLKFFTFNY